MTEPIIVEVGGPVVGATMSQGPQGPQGPAGPAGPDNVQAGRPVGNAAPSTGNTLIWNGSQWAPGLVSGTATSFTAVGTVSKQDWFCSANDPTDSSKVVPATLANLQAAGMHVLGVALSTANNGSFSGATKGTAVDDTIHGLTADAAAIEAGFVVLDTSTARAVFRRIADPDDIILGSISSGSSSHKGILGVDPQLPRGRVTVNILDPQWGAYVLPSGKIVIDGALKKIISKYLRSGCLVRIHGKRKRDRFVTAVTIRNDETIFDSTDLNADTLGAHVRFGLRGITFEGDAGGQIDASNGAYLDTQLRDFGWAPGNNMGRQLSILNVDATRNMVEVSIPQADIWPVYTNGTTYHQGDFVRPSAGHNGFFYRCNSTSGVAGTEPGVSGNPAWPTTEGATVAGTGGITWEAYLCRPTFPLSPKEWVDRHIGGPVEGLGGCWNNYHRVRLLVTSITNNGADGNPIKLLCAVRGVWQTMQFVEANGTSPPTVTVTGTTTQPVDLRIECTVGGANRAAATIRYSTIPGTPSWTTVAGPSASIANINGTGLTVTLGNTAYASDNTWRSQNFCGQDDNNGAIYWRLHRFALQNRGSQIQFRNCAQVGNQGYFLKGFINWTMSPRTGASTNTKLHIDDVVFSRSAPASWSTAPLSLNVSGFAAEYAGGVFRDSFVDSDVAIAWPVAAEPGHTGYRNADGASITPWSSGQVCTSGVTVVRPSGDASHPRNGYQYRAQTSATTTGTETTAWPTSWGSTITFGGVTWKAEWEGEDASLTAWASGQVVTVGTIRAWNPRNGWQLRAVTAGTTGSALPAQYDAAGTALINRWDRISDGGVTWDVEYALNAKPQTSLYSSFNNDYLKINRVDSLFANKSIHMDDTTGQAREYWAREWNPSLVNRALSDDTEPYTGAYGHYGQLDWSGGTPSCRTMVRLGGSAQDIALRNVQTEGSSRICDLGAGGGSLSIDGMRMNIGAANGHPSGEYIRFGGARLSVSNGYIFSFGQGFNIAITNASALGAGSKPMQVHLENFTTNASPAVDGSPMRMKSTRRPPFRAANLQTIGFSYNPGTLSTIQAGSLTCTLLTADFGDLNDARGHEYAKAINRDCGYNQRYSSLYAANEIIIPGHRSDELKKDSSGRFLQYKVTSGGGAGASGTADPTWPTAIGGTVAWGSYTLTAEELNTFALYGYSDESGELFVEVKGARGPSLNTDQKDYPPRLRGSEIGQDSLSITASSTAQRELGLSTTCQSYAPHEMAHVTAGVVAPAGENNQGVTRYKVELHLDGLNLVSTSGIDFVVRTISGQWEMPYTGFGALLEPWWTSPRQHTIATVSGTVVPLRNAGARLTFSGTNPVAGRVFDTFEWDTDYTVGAPCIVSKTAGTPNPVAYTITKTKTGITVERQPPVGSGRTEVADFPFSRLYPLPTEFDPNALETISPGCALLAWHKNSDIAAAVGAWNTTGWVNSSTTANSAKLSAFKRVSGDSSSNDPTVSTLASGLSEATFDGVNSANADKVEATFTGTISQPVSFFIVVKGLQSDAGVRTLISGKGATEWTINYTGSTDTWDMRLPTAGTITAGASYSIRDTYHVIHVKVDESVVTGTNRRTKINRDGGTYQRGASDHGTDGASTAIALCGRWGGSSFNNGNAGNYSICEFIAVQGPLSPEGERKTVQYLVNKFGALGCGISTFAPEPSGTVVITDPATSATFSWTSGAESSYEPEILGVYDSAGTPVVNSHIVTIANKTTTSFDVVLQAAPGGGGANAVAVHVRVRRV